MGSLVANEQSATVSALGLISHRDDRDADGQLDHDIEDDYVSIKFPYKHEKLRQPC